MPHPRIEGMPARLGGTPQLEQFRYVDFPYAICQVEGLGSAAGDVRLATPHDIDPSASHWIMMDYPCLFTREARDKKALQALAQASLESLVEFILKYIPECRIAEVYVPSRFEESGFAFAIWHRPT